MPGRGSSQRRSATRSPARSSCSAPSRSPRRRTRTAAASGRFPPLDRRAEADSELGRHARHAPRAAQAESEARRLAPRGADPAGRLRGRGRAHRGHRSPAPRAARRPAPARALPRAGLHPPRPLARLPRAGRRLDPARDPARPALALRPGRRAAARGARAGRGALGRAVPAQGAAQRLRAGGRGEDARPARALARRRRPPHARRGDPAANSSPRPRATSRSCCRSSSRAPRSWRRSRSRSSGKRGEREEKDLRETLERQRERVREELAKHEGELEQLTLDFGEEDEAPARGQHALVAQAPRAVRPRPRAGAAADPRVLRGPRAARRAGRPRLSLAGDELIAMAKLDPAILAHLEWIGFVRPTGLVVSAPALVRAGAILDRRDAEGQRLLRALRRGARVRRESERPAPWLPDFRAFADLGARLELLAKGYAGTADSPIPPELEVPLPDYGETLRPDFAVRELEPQDGASAVAAPRAGRSSPARTSTAPSAATGSSRPRPTAAWSGCCARPACRRACSSTAARCASSRRRAARARAGSTSASRTWSRPRAGRSRPRCACCSASRGSSACRARSASPRSSTTAASSRTRSASGWPSRCCTRSTSCCAASRRRTTRRRASCCAQPLAEHPDEVYRALLTVILRLVFLLYAEERDMLPEDETFLRYYSLAGPLRAAARGRRALPGHDGPALRRLGAAPRALPHGPRRRRVAARCGCPSATASSSIPTASRSSRAGRAAARARSTSGSSRRSCPTARSTARSRSCSSSTASASPTARSTWSRSARSTRR